MAVLRLKQGALTESYRLELGPESVEYLHAEVLSSRKKIYYGQVTALFHDAGKAYLVAGNEVYPFLHQPESADYGSFVEELVRRVRSARGA